MHEDDQKGAKAKVPVGEVAGLADAMFWGNWIGSLVREHDGFFAGGPWAVRHYRDLLRDDQIFATYQQRRTALLSRPIEVVAGGTEAADEKAAEWLREQVVHLDMHHILNLAHYGLWYGYSIAELVYAVDGAHVAIDAIRVRERERFRLGLNGEVYLCDHGYGGAGRGGQSTSAILGERMPDHKFWTYVAGGDSDDRVYGSGLGYNCYWPVVFRRANTEDWTIFLEKFASPTPIGTYPSGSEPEKVDKFLDLLTAIRTDYAITLEEGYSADAFESARSSRDTYEPRHAVLDKIISKIILSQTMTTDDGSSRSQAEVHAGVAKSLIMSDARLLLGSLSAGSGYHPGPIEWMTQWNFPGAATPRLRCVWEEPEDADALAARDERLSRVGYVPTLQRIEEVYGAGYERRSANVAAATSGDMKFAAPDADSEFADAVGEAAAAQVEDWTAAALRLLGEVADLDEYAERLIELYPDMPLDGLASALGDGMAAANLAGRAAVEEGE